MPPKLGVAVKDGVVTLNGRWTVTGKIAADARRRASRESERCNELGYTCHFTNAQMKTCPRAVMTGVVRFRAKRPGQGQGIQGMITLEGMWIGNFKKQARKAVRNLVGVRVVLTTLKSKPQVSSTEVKSAIEAALKRSVE